MKIPIPQFLILVLIVWFGSLQNTQAVNPPPDGGYPLGNTAEGDDALFSLTANGAANTAIGAHALYFNTTGDDNTAVGFVALNFNEIGSQNTAIGYGALSRNTTGVDNIAMGFAAGSALTTGSQNIDIGSTGVAGESGTIRIGEISQTRTFIAGIRGVAVTGSPVVVSSSHQLGVVPSSQRFKE